MILQCNKCNLTLYVYYVAYVRVFVHRRLASHTHRSNGVVFGEVKSVSCFVCLQAGL